MSARDTLYGYAKKAVDETREALYREQIRYAMDKAAANKSEEIYGKQSEVTRAWRKLELEALVKMQACFDKHEEALEAYRSVQVD
jgi:hypothetical protein